MEKLRPIRNYGGVYVIKLKPIDMQDLNLEIDKMVDISKIKVKEDER